MRFLGVALCALALLPVSGGAAVVGELRVLVIRATWGPEPGGDAELTAATDGAATFVERASFGKLRLRFDVTPWLHAYPNMAICPAAADDDDEARSALGPISELGRRAAVAAGADPAAYDRVVFVLPERVCGLRGLGVRGEVLLFEPRALGWGEIVHELGHTFGLAHAGAANCATSCRIGEYGDRLSPMGQGGADFSAFEKQQLGWLARTAPARRSGTYVVGTPTSPTELPQALLVHGATGTFWVEHRLEPERALVVRFVSASPRSGFTGRSILLSSRGATFAARGFFTVTRVRSAGETAVLRVRFARR